MRMAAPIVLLAVLAAATPGPALGGDAQTPNGISVGKPKVFDNRTLTIMLESLSQTLQGVQSQQFADKAALTAALSAIQGTRSTDTNSSFSILGSPTPSSDTQVTQNMGLVNAAGTTLPDTTTTVTKNVQAALTPTAPTLTDATAFAGFTPTFGSSAGDLLSDSINLNYQIFNLRMILERSLSDRLLDQGARMQAVLGINVTIDPPRTAVDSVAVVEITLKGTQKDLELVALMPQEKTYNAATLTTKSRAFGGSAVVNMIQVGANTRRRGQTFYLYRDNDTIAYERMGTDGQELVFGWMFRPVLGRRAVAPGFRQLFAIAALSGADCGDTAACPAQKLSASVRTFWKKYDAGTLTSFESSDANRAARFRYAATFGLTRPEIFQSRYVNSRAYTDITVKTTSEYERQLGPLVQQVSWNPVGPKHALITAKGGNFFTGTKVVLGDKTYTAADGLLLKSNDSFELIAPLDALSTGPAVISGRYGAAVQLVAKDPVPASAGAFIKTAEIGPPIAGTHTLSIFLQNLGRDENGNQLPLRLTDLPADPATPLVTINGQTVSNTSSPIETGGQVLLQGWVPSTAIADGNATIKVSWPFLPARWSLVHRTTLPEAAYQIVRVGEKSFLLRSKKPSGFVKRTDDHQPLTASQCWQLFVGDKPFKLKTTACPGGDDQSEPAGPNVVAVTLTKAVPDRVAILDPALDAVMVLEVPKVVAKTEAAAEKPISVTQFDSVFVEFPVEKAASVQAVTANQQALSFAPKSDKADETKIKVHITRALSSRPGNVDVTIVDAAGKSSTARLVVEPCLACRSEGK